MYGTLALRPKPLDEYRPFISDQGIDEIRRLAAPVRGLRVLHLSVTAFGTGVAELLTETVPLLSDVGLECSWQVVRSAEEFASANKALYRALAGAESDWPPELGDVWLRYSAMNAEFLTEPFDVVIVHDPQPAAIRSFAAAAPGTRWVLHSHLDLSSAQPDAWALLHDHIADYDALVFDTEAFVHPSLRSSEVSIIRPAIDPLSPRNMDLSRETVELLLDRYCIDAERPLISQLAPCDPGSDMLGAIEVFDNARREVPGLQFVLIASNPPEDARSIDYFNEVVAASMEYPDVHIVRGVSEVGNVEVNALQRASDVVLQKGLRKGFGIWISEAQWKERPVVTARAGGLAQQVVDGETGFFAGTTQECTERVVQLLRDPELGRRLGGAGRRHVAERFLLPRLVADELRLLTRLTRDERA